MDHSVTGRRAKLSSTDKPREGSAKEEGKGRRRSREGEGREYRDWGSSVRREGRRKSIRIGRTKNERREKRG